MLARIIRTYLDGGKLPARVGSMPLLDWLGSLSRDQREFHSGNLANAIGVTTERPWIGETASALKFRLEESSQHGAA